MTTTASPDLPDHLEDDDQSVAAPKSGVLRFARMTGSSIAARDSAFWVTDFLNAAYYRRPAGDRAVEDLRLAFSILTTYWYGKGSGRLHLTDLRRLPRRLRQRAVRHRAVPPGHAQPQSSWSPGPSA